MINSPINKYYNLNADNPHTNYTGDIMKKPKKDELDEVFYIPFLTVILSQIEKDSPNKVLWEEIARVVVDFRHLGSAEWNSDPEQRGRPLEIYKKIQEKFKEKE